MLRKTNDQNLNNQLTYLNLNNDDNIQLKVIDLKGIVATKISKTGKIQFIKNNININNNIFKTTLKSLDFDNDFDMNIQLNNVNKYTYSYFGIEFPEIRYKQISDYNIEKKIRVKQKGYTLYIQDYESNYYYIFDLSLDFKNKKLPYSEIPISTLIFTQVFSFIINIILVNALNLHLSLY
jgi:hypothetical protein